MVRLNLGAGPSENPSSEPWIRVDIDRRWNPDILHDIRDPLPFQSKSIDEIWASHVLEHVENSLTLSILKDWHRVLVPGGRLGICVPNMDLAFSSYLGHPGDGNCYLGLHFFVYSAAGGPYSYHLAFFEKRWFEHYLPQIGFGQLEFRNIFGENNICLAAFKNSN